MNVEVFCPLEASSGMSTNTPIDNVSFVCIHSKSLHMLVPGLVVLTVVHAPGFNPFTQDPVSFSNTAYLNCGDGCDPLPPPIKEAAFLSVIKVTFKGRFPSFSITNGPGIEDTKPAQPNDLNPVPERFANNVQLLLEEALTLPDPKSIRFTSNTNDAVDETFTSAVPVEVARLHTFRYRCLQSSFHSRKCEHC